MASTTLQNRCVKCNNGIAQILCAGCEQWLCLKHLLEHRQELRKEMDRLTDEHNELYQHLVENTDDQHPLFIRINTWEEKSIEKIRQVAQEVRHDLRKYLERAKIRIRISLSKVTKELQTSRETNSYTEVDLKAWLNRLRELRQQLDKPTMIELAHDQEETLKKIRLIELQYKHDKVHSPLSLNTRWNSHAITVAGGRSSGHALNQLHCPYGLDIDDDGTVFVADMLNHRIIAWKSNASNGEVIIGKKGQGNGIDQLNQPVMVMIERKTENFILTEEATRRITRWSQRAGATGKLILSDIVAGGITIDHEGFIYVSDFEKHEVRRYGQNDREGVLVAGGHGRGDALNQLNCPRHLFVDRDHSLYISDRDNHRVVKWLKDAKEGFVVAGGNGQGNNLNQLHCPGGIFVDSIGSIYIVDQMNHRIVRWLLGGREGQIIAGGKGQGSQSNQLCRPASLIIDQSGSLYVADMGNHRIQRFAIE